MRTIGLFLVDLILVLIGSIGALVVRNDFALPHDKLVAFLPYLGMTLASAGFVIAAFSLHRSVWSFTSFRDFERVAVAGAIAVLGAILADFFANRLEGVPRALPVLQLMLVLALMLGARAVTRRVHQKRSSDVSGRAPAFMQSKGGRSTVLIVGVNAIAELYVKSSREAGSDVLEVAGILGLEQREVGRFVHFHRILGVPDDVRRIVRDLAIEGVVVDRIAVTVPIDRLSDKARAALADLDQGEAVELQFLADQLGLHDREGVRGEKKAIGHGAGSAFTPAELALVEGRSYWAWKRALDVVGASCLLTVCLPLIVLIGIAVALDVGAPVMFCQRRPGRYGRPFRVYKFRSMAHAYDRDGHRIDDALRSSWLGRLLRRSRLDELLQLYNVLTGEMSFVGPRPLLPIDQAPEYVARLLVRPGLTGWAQINGGRDVNPVDKAALDVWYVQNASLWLDIRIVLGTIPMVLFGERVKQAMIARAWLDLGPTGICTGWRDGARSSAAVLAPARAAASHQTAKVA